jgi:hypothetical protein
MVSPAPADPTPAAMLIVIIPSARGSDFKPPKIPVLIRSSPAPLRRFSLIYANQIKSRTALQFEQSRRDHYEPRLSVDRRNRQYSDLPLGRMSEAEQVRVQGVDLC